MRRPGSTVLALAACLATLPAGPAHGRDVPVLEAMRRSGLEGVRAVPVKGRREVINLEGVLPGTSGLEVVLSALVDGSGCAVVLAAAADLKRTPLRHTVRVVLFEGEGRALLASRGWVGDIGPAGRGRILAALHVDKVGWAGSAGPFVQTLPAEPEAGGEPVFPPAWLAHFLLRSGRVADWPLSVGGNRSPLLSQLVLRSVRTPLEVDSNAFLERGVPAASLSDSSYPVRGPARRLDPRRLEGWSRLLAAAVRQLDGLAGRPLPEDRYLAAFGRVWPRRDLLWAGFLVWALLVFRGRPGRWRGTSAEEHGRQMRTYLPGFLFRGLLLLAIFLAPVFSVLLLPAAVLALVPPKTRRTRALWLLLGLLPFLFYLGALGIALQSGRGGFRGDPAATVLVPATLLAYGVMIGRPGGIHPPRRSAP